MTNKEWYEQLGLLSPVMRTYVKGCIAKAEFLEYLEGYGVNEWSEYKEAEAEYKLDREQLL